MKSTGIIRRIDDLGRIVIPREVRQTLRIREGEPLEVCTGSDGSVILKKYAPNAMAEIASAIAYAMRNKHIQFAIYDTDYVLERDGRLSNIIDIVPNNWYDHRSVFHEGCYTIYPIISKTDFYGFIAIRGTDYSEYIQGVIGMVSSYLYLN